MSSPRSSASAAPDPSVGRFTRPGLVELAREPRRALGANQVRVDTLFSGVPEGTELAGDTQVDPHAFFGHGVATLTETRDVRELGRARQLIDGSSAPVRIDAGEVGEARPS